MKTESVSADTTRNAAETEAASRLPIQQLPVPITDTGRYQRTTSVSVPVFGCCVFVPVQKPVPSACLVVSVT